MNIFEEKHLMPWIRQTFGGKEGLRYIYKRYTEPTWKRRGRCIATVCHTSDFKGFKEHGLFSWNVPSCKEHESGGWGYTISLQHYVGWRGGSTEVTEFIEEVYYGEETVNGVIFYADLKLSELGFKVKEPFNMPIQRKVVKVKLWNGTCQRCLKKASGHSMSWFDESLICYECSCKEAKHPKYNEARAKELSAVQNGNFNFKGIGYTPG